MKNAFKVAFFRNFLRILDPFSVKNRIRSVIFSSLFVLLVAVSGNSQQICTPNSAKSGFFVHQTVQNETFFGRNNTQTQNNYNFNSVKEESVIIRPTMPYTNTYDYSKPATVIKNGEVYQTLPYTNARDYTKPSYRVDKLDW
jgi:hypothetical protein